MGLVQYGLITYSAWRLGAAYYLHGEPRRTVRHFGHELASTSLLLAVLKLGGFFG